MKRSNGLKYVVKDIILIIAAFLLICSMFFLSYLIELKSSSGIEVIKKSENAVVEDTNQINIANEEEKVINFISDIFPDITGYEKIDSIYRLTQGGSISGYAFIANGEGYNGEIKILVTTDAGFYINEINILSQNETEGLGSRIVEDLFLDQFRGLNPDKIYTKNEGGQLNTIEGAFISSNAVIKAVRDRTYKAIEVSNQFTVVENNSGAATTSTDNTTNTSTTPEPPATSDATTQASPVRD